MPDNQTVILRDELQKLWQNRDVFAEVQKLEGNVAREMPGRQTLRFVLDGKAYYRKLHTGVGWGEIFKNLVRLRLPIIGARNEWNALNRLAELDVPSLNPIAFGERNINPAKRLSFIITRELTGTVKLDAYLRTHLSEPPMPFPEKKALVQEVARMTRTMHQHGINHRDLYLCHFLLRYESLDDRKRGEPPVIHLVDLHRAQMRSRVPGRWLVKDVGSIYFSAMELGITRGDIYRFLIAYFDKPLEQIMCQQKALLRSIERRALKLYQREQRLKARGLRN